jgi:CubicO group peptidase (beta-lactamase class C family)
MTLACRPLLAQSLACPVALVLAACSGSSSSTSTDASADGPALSTRTAAAEATAAHGSTCSMLPAFYWEIGDASGAIVSGTVGAGFTATTVMSIASASKLVWGAYVVERFKDDLSIIDESAMRMQSGYVDLAYDSCVTTTTVSACFMAGNNATLVPADVGRFFYNGGHFQKYAVDLGLGGDSDAALTTEIKRLVGTELAFTYGSPQLAGGIRTSASDYAAFLRKILRGDLAIHDHLGESAVCTLPSSCSTAVYSPAPAAWHYSYAHWVEDDPATGDGAFSSPGAFGFYPWIDQSKTYYGIVARESLATQAYVASAECGATIRKAFMTGVAQ